MNYHPVFLELLSPAKNADFGIEAINHGADAVYIGAPRFGARAAAGNSLEDIAALVQHAHVYNARIYVTVNTILRDEELKDTEAMIWDLYRAGVDALIIQNPKQMGYLSIKAAAAAIDQKLSGQGKIYTEAKMVTKDNLQSPEIKQLICTRC